MYVSKIGWPKEIQTCIWNIFIVQNEYSLKQRLAAGVPRAKPEPNPELFEIQPSSF